MAYERRSKNQVKRDQRSRSVYQYWNMTPPMARGDYAIAGRRK
jgi:hypothetical protein